MIRALFFDLDGTLLDSGKKIPQSACRAIRRCREKGVKVFFATARSPRFGQTLKWTQEEYDLFDGAIYANGACVELDGRRQFSIIDPAFVRDCVRTVRDFQNVHMSLHTPDDGYAFNFERDEKLMESWNLKDAILHEIDEETMNQTVKMMIFYDRLMDSTRELPPELSKTLASICDGRANVYVTDAGRSIQASAKDAGKLNAIERLRTALRLNPDEIAVFGDDYNDLEMISHYPSSVAMGNAVPQVKAAAGLITKSNDENGIAYALENLLRFE